ncbi:MAG TPA: tetratricopeptide repeat protein [Anaerolineales bacterium]
MPDQPPRTHNLPALLSSFVGRAREVGEIRNLLGTERLVTLTGTGGCGKTRLALELAGEVLPDFQGGVWLIELGPLTDGALVPQEIASALNVREQGGHALMETLANQLQARRSLLVLDNCEHLVLACARAAETLLLACPLLTILTTSREPLGVAGEVVRIVPPLSLPTLPEVEVSPRHQDPLRIGSEAVQLFMARAQAAAPAFELTPENAAAVTEICLRLDGLPLAIELAAACLRSLSVQQVARLLDDRFQLLKGGSRTAPARQRTLEAALDWSYTLLSDEERRVLQRLSVFAGGCTLQAAEAVCPGETVQAEEVLEVLSRLVDKSLVVADAAGEEARYHLLETIREYARQRLSASEDGAEARNRHLQYFVNWAENGEAHLHGGGQLEWLRRFDAEHGNLRAALDWSQMAEERAESGLRLAAAAGYFWELHGYPTDGRMRLSAALAHTGAQGATAARATALNRLAILTFLQSDFHSVLTLENQSLAIWRTMGEAGRLGVAIGLEISAMAESEMGNYAAAFPLYEEALGIFQQLQDLPGIADTLKMLGSSLMRTGEYAQAEQRLDEALLVSREVGDRRQIAATLAESGELAIRRGQYDRAELLLKESLEHSRSLEDKWGIAVELGSQAWLALARRDHERARTLLGESLGIRRRIGDRGGMAWCVEKLALMAARQKESKRAATLLGAAAALRAPVHSAVDPADQPEFERMLAGVRAAIGEREFTASWADGKGMSIDGILEYALPEPALTATESQRLEKERFGGLTARERQAAALIAQGRSNREIAQAMTVGVKTAETYVTRILNKLGLESRVQIAIWAKDKGLAPVERPE